MVSNKRPKASKNGTKPQPQASSPSPPPPESSPVPTEDAAPPSYPPRVTAFLQQVSWTPANPNSPSFPGQVLKHALAGDPRAMAIYGLFLQTGSGGVLRDEKLALAWLTSAASALLVDDSEKSNGIGTVPIGTSLKNPKSTNIASTLSPSKNVSSKTASTKSVDNTTPQIPSSPRPDIPAPTSAIASHEMAPIVQVLGDAYRRGLGCSPDLNTAFRLLQRAAQLGHSDGLVGLANMYERGDGVVRDENIAFGLFKKAADRGSVYAMFKVGQGLERGKGTHVDYVQAKHWYRQAAARGHFPSSVRLAILSMDPACESIDMLAAAAESLKTPRSFHDYAAGLSTSHHGAVPNIKEARKWYRRSANAGYVRAQWLLGSAYAEAAKVNPKEFRKAFYWYHAAAVQGFQPAQWAVGNMYRLGQGVEKDLVIADKWHRAASRSGMERCNVDAFDSAIVTVHSLTESVAPVWNTAEGTRPPGVFDNLGVPFLPIVTPVVLPEDSFSGPLAPGVVFANQGESPTHNVKVEAGSSAHNKSDEDGDTIEAEHEGYKDIQSLLNSIGHRTDSVHVNEMIFYTTISALKTLKSANITSSPPANPSSPVNPADFSTNPLSRSRASAPANLNAVPSLALTNGNNADFLSGISIPTQTQPPPPQPPLNGLKYQAAISSLSSTPAFGLGTGAFAKAAPAPLHEKSARSPTVSDILRHYPGHPATALLLLEAKKNLLAFEVFAAKYRPHEAVAELGACIRSMWGLFDHTNQAFRILAALCIQSVLAELATAPPRDEYKDWHVDEMPVPEYGVGIWHEAAVADVFINMYARTPELSIAALDKIVADRQRAVDIAMAKAALAEAHYMQTGKRDIPPQFEFVRKLANVNGGNNEKKNKGKKKSGGGVGGGGNGGGNGTTSSLEADSATTTFKPPLPLSLPVEIEPSTTSSPQDQLPVDDNPASTHPRLLRAASTRLDPLPYLLRGAFKARMGMWDKAVEDYDLAEKAEAKWVERVPEVWYHRGVCYSNMPGALCRERSIQDLGRFLGMVQVDHRRVPDAHYTIAGNHFALKNVRLVVDHFAKALEAEAVRFPFLPPIINSDLKTRLTLEVKYALVIGGTHVRSTPWSKVPGKVLRMVEGDEPANSIARECLACHALGRTRTCGGCLTARYCSTNCQIAHWIRGHAQMCQIKKAAAVAVTGI